MNTIIDNINVAVEPIERITAEETLSFEQYADLAALTAEKRRVERTASYAIINRYVEFGLLIKHHGDGAPYLAGSTGAGRRIAFSLSHSRRFVAIAWSDDSSRNIGVDVEQPSERLERVSARFLTARESTMLSDSSNDPRSADPDERATMLLGAWTLKEAVYKAARTPGLALAGDDGIAVTACSRHDDNTIDWRVKLPDGTAMKATSLPLDRDADPMMFPDLPNAYLTIATPSSRPL